MTWKSVLLNHHLYPKPHDIHWCFFFAIQGIPSAHLWMNTAPFSALMFCILTTLEHVISCWCHTQFGNGHASKAQGICRSKGTIFTKHILFIEKSFWNMIYIYTYIYIYIERLLDHSCFVEKSRRVLQLPWRLAAVPPIYMFVAE